MKSSGIGLLATVLLFFVTNSCHGQPAEVDAVKTSSLLEADMRNILGHTCSQANTFYTANHFPVLAPPPTTCNFSLTNDQAYRESVGVFGPTEDSLVGGNILAKSGKLIRFYNYAAAHASQNTPIVYPPPLPTWTEAHTIEVATKFAGIFLKAWPDVSFGTPIVRNDHVAYNTDKTTGKLKSGPVEWTVRWREQTTSGIPYLTGGMVVMLSEKYGPFAIYLNFMVQYKDEQITPLVQNRALIEARKGLDKIVAWGPAKEWLSGMKIEGEPEAKLMVVQPNDITAQKSIIDAGFSNQLEARLAWVVTYKVLTMDRNGNGTVSVYIDAKDGSFLGGFF